jgi:hypothetical protein
MRKGKARRTATKPLARAGRPLAPGPRWNPDPQDVQRSVIKLVLSLVEFIRQLMERQAIRRMENKTLEPDEVEALGQALMQLEQTVAEIARQFDLDPADLNVDLGPLGKLT